MKKIFKYLLIVLMMVLLVGCGTSEVKEANSGSGLYKTSYSNSVVDTNTSLKIKYTAEYTIYTSDSELKYTIKEKVNELGGEITNSYETESYSDIDYKVPTDKFDEFLDYLDRLDGVGTREISSTDITSSYNYTEARIETLEASKAVYEELLESAETLADITAIRSELTDITSELTSLYNTKAAYDNELDYSKVTITYYEEGDEFSNFFSEYFESLGDIFLGLGIALLYIIPVGGTILLIVLGIIGIVKAIKNKKNKKKDVVKE